jgi:hypothetical protein
MVEVLIEEMSGSDWKPIERLQTSHGRRCRVARNEKHERENLFQVKRKKCVQKQFDRADIVRDVR